MSKLATIALSAFILAGPALAQAPKAAEASGLDKMVCKRFDVTGSISRKKRICKTVREWDQSLANARETMDGFMKNTCGAEPGTCTVPTGE